MRNLIILFVLVLTTMSCGRGNSGAIPVEDAHDHAGEGGRQLTLFTDSSELYVEYPTLISGVEADFLVHLTRLRDYKPYSEGTVRVTLDFGENKTTGLADTPEVTGIWLVELSPEFSGECSIVFEYITENASEKFVFIHGEVDSDQHGSDEDTGAGEPASHTGEPESHNGESASHEGESPAPEGTRFTKEQAWKSEFAVTLLEPSPFTGIIKAGGEILAMPGEKYFIHARTTGIVNYSKKDLVAGGQIQKAEEMMRIEGQDLAQGNIAVDFKEAENRFTQSRSEYERRVNLFRENAISEKQFIETRSTYISDSIRFHNLRQSYVGGGLKITSPIAGHIHELLVSQGEYVEAGQLIATVSSDQRLLLRADVSQQYFSRIADIVSTNFRTSYHKKVFDITELDGSLLAIGSSVLENNQYLPVYFEAQNNGQLLEGAYAEFFLKTKTLENCMLVPNQAVLEEQGRYFVFVQTSGEIFQKREIRPGETDGVNYNVVGGLSPGERVVTKGSMILKAASMSTALPGDSHQH